MNATAAIAKSLLSRDVLSIKTAFNQFGVTNLPREIGRSIERKFNVEVKKKRIIGESRYGVQSTWFEYRLVKSKNSPESIEKMKE